MNAAPIAVSVAIFIATILATFVVSILGGRHARQLEASGLASQKLNKWFVGLSAGATANSGFVVTGAVGLGYSQGMQWVLLPLAWLLGDVVFWTLFPGRLNAAGAAAKASTLTDLVVFRIRGPYRRALKLAIALIVLACLSGYVAAQWLAGQKFLRGAFDFGSGTSLTLFATLIVCYTAVGGFRGSVYADTLQALIRIAGTGIAFSAVVGAATSDWAVFQSRMQAMGPEFLRIAPQGSILAVLGFVVGFAAAALGFGLGQPQMVTRYLAGKSPNETQAAWWIYLGFVQFTWIAMTLFGVTLRGVMPELSDPELGLSLFFRSSMGPVWTGLIVADIFATIAATSNSLLVAMSQTVEFDLVGSIPRRANDDSGTARSRTKTRTWLITAVIGIATMGLSLVLNATVVSLALASVSLMGAALAPAVMIRVLGWRHTPSSLLASIFAGLGTATLWRFFGWPSALNEAAVGLAIGLAVNIVFSRKPKASISSLEEAKS